MFIRNIHFWNFRYKNDYIGSNIIELKPKVKISFILIKKHFYYYYYQIILFIIIST